MKRGAPAFEVYPPWRSLPLADGGTLVFEQREVKARAGEAAVFKGGSESDVLRFDLHVHDSEGRELRASSLVNGTDLWLMLAGQTAFSEAGFFGRALHPPSEKRMFPLGEDVFYSYDSRTLHVFRIEREGADEDGFGGLVFSHLNKYSSFFGVDVFLLLHEPDEEDYVPPAEIVLVYKMSGSLKSVGGVEMGDRELVYLPISPGEIFWQRNVLPGVSSFDPSSYTWSSFLPVPVFALTGESGGADSAVKIVDEPWDPVASVWEQEGTS